MNVPAFQPVPLRLPLSQVAALADVMARVIANRARQRDQVRPVTGYGFHLRARTTAAKLRAALSGQTVATAL
jgi:hypothetical protein